MGSLSLGLLKWLVAPDLRRVVLISWDVWHHSRRFVCLHCICGDVRVECIVEEIISYDLVGYKVGRCWLKCVDKEKSVLYYWGQPSFVASVLYLQLHSPHLVRWSGWHCIPPSISNGQDKPKHWLVVLSICHEGCRGGGACNEGIVFCKNGGWRQSLYWWMQWSSWVSEMWQVSLSVVLWDHQVFFYSEW